ncbi:SH3 domain-containing protein [Peribacillus glennii]|uniref:SH3 domain-containing protein n=1 Tax=Peribacillus glennii TaxID=2303991 RepID=A0A372L9A8_9BACI|nr:SH3 domain-containing protein [Peribacillus glennii]RFU61119.1 SH3 domain-containing protein [Peribacillus glennii]
MKIHTFTKLLICFILAFSFLFPLTSNSGHAAATKIAYVDVSGSLNVRSGPGTSYKKVGSLKDNAKVTVYAKTNNEWAEIRFKKKKAYVATQYLRFYSSISSAEVKRITDRVIAMQRKTWERNYTKKQIFSIMSPGFTTSFIEKFFKQQMRYVGNDKNGNSLYHQIETEVWGYNVDAFDWDLSYSPKKPSAKFYTKSGTQYLIVSQYFYNDMDGNHWSYLYLSRSSSKSNWKVYKNSRKYD